jgi:hypothetical protein
MRQLRRAAVALVVAIAGVVAAPGPADAAVYGPADIYTFARWAGFSRDQATTMTAIALAESGGNSNAHNSSGEDSRGLWQINLDAHGSWAGTMNLFDPVQNAQAAFRGLRERSQHVAVDGDPRRDQRALPALPFGGAVGCRRARRTTDVGRVERITRLRDTRRTGRPGSGAARRVLDGRRGRRRVRLR